MSKFNRRFFNDSLSYRRFTKANYVFVSTFYLMKLRRYYVHVFKLSSQSFSSFESDFDSNPRSCIHYLQLASFQLSRNPIQFILLKNFQFLLKSSETSCQPRPSLPYFTTSLRTSFSRFSIKKCSRI